MSIEKEVSSEGDFKAAWHEIYVYALQGGYQVFAGNVFTHASKQDDKNDGLEFSGAGDVDEDQTLHHSEIVALKRLPWANNGFLILTGCNTGLAKGRKWAPAFSFALVQGVPVVGQAGYAYFSSHWSTYKETTPGNERICLWAYRRGQNAVMGLGDGRRMAGIVFKV